MRKLIYALTIVMLTIAPAAAQQLQKINPSGLSKPAPGTYTHIVRSGKLLFIAGQTPINASGQVVGSTMKDQLEQVMSNLLIALKSQGADFTHVTKTTTFVTSISQFRTPEVAAVRTKYVGANPPAHTPVQIQQIADPAYKIEI